MRAQVIAAGPGSRTAGTRRHRGRAFQAAGVIVAAAAAVAYLVAIAAHPMAAMLKGIIASLKVEKKKRDSSATATTEWFKGLEPKLLKIGAVTLAPSTEAGKSSGLTFHYPPYAVGPYAEGEYVAFVPWETLKPHLSAEGAKIFAGARPKGDPDGTQ